MSAFFVLFLPWEPTWPQGVGRGGKWINSAFNMNEFSSSTQLETNKEHSSEYLIPRRKRQFQCNNNNFTREVIAVGLPLPLPLPCHPFQSRCLGVVPCLPLGRLSDRGCTYCVQNIARAPPFSYLHVMPARMEIKSTGKCWWWVVGRGSRGVIATKASSRPSWVQVVERAERETCEGATHYLLFLLTRWPGRQLEKERQQQRCRWPI